MAGYNFPIKSQNKLNSEREVPATGQERKETRQEFYSDQCSQATAVLSPAPNSFFNHLKVHPKLSPPDLASEAQPQFCALLLACNSDFSPILEIGAPRSSQVKVCQQFACSPAHLK